MGCKEYGSSVYKVLTNEKVKFKLFAKSLAEK